ncbi:MAG: ArsC family reductase [SAR86 cluster bacterium]|uniref:ArsC family reductase n=1 Tax=SAR86 cluster bacterium TaxID=2030880 RepID=A0A2A5B0F5_9GAMM|nr:MAG: ArsC family reductase [SAR86 cluster bacterium]
MTTLFGINNCDTIKKTKKWFDDHNVDYQFHDYKKLDCSEQLIKQFLEHFSYQELINTRGTTWRKLPDSVKSSLDRKSAITLMHEQPSMIKRPLINSEGSWLLGFNEKQLEDLFI